jgi:DNA-binding beta-propeller fold protein YncE
MLTVSRSDPMKLTMIGEPVKVPGEFPNTVAASMNNSVVCVGMTGAKAGVSCSSFSDKGLGEMDDLRPFDLQQTTPPMGPTNTVSQVLFSGDESMLFTMVKGDPAVNNTGFMASFNIENTNGAMAVSKHEVRSSPEGTAVLFGSQVIPGTSKVFATDASFGAAILDIDANTCEATTLATGEVEGQTATCWVAISPVTKTAFVTDVGRNRLVEMSLEDASVVSELDLTCNGDPGLIDLAAAGNFIYALSPGNGSTEAAVTVLDVTGGSGSANMIQHFELEGVAGRTAMGMKVMM